MARHELLSVEPRCERLISGRVLWLRIVCFRLRSGNRTARFETRRSNGAEIPAQQGFDVLSVFTLISVATLLSERSKVKILWAVHSFSRTGSRPMGQDMKVRRLCAI